MSQSGPDPRPFLPIGLMLALFLHFPFLGQAYHVDDTNFLTLARGVLADPLRPHLVSINWLGTSQPAFDVLSNPPGIAYVLALGLLLGGGEILHHLLLLPFTLLAAWGGFELGRRFTRDHEVFGYALALSPAVVVSAHTVMPDLPLLACLLAGLALFIRGVDEHRGWVGVKGALLLGMGVWFRYSGLMVLPLALVYILCQPRDRWLRGVGLALISGIPLVLLITHDLYAYGQVHFIHMGSFQRGEDGPGHLGRQVLAQVTFLGGAAFVPLMPVWPMIQSRVLTRKSRIATLGGIGLGAGFTLGMLQGYSLLDCGLLGLCLSTGLVWLGVLPAALGSMWGGVGGRRADDMFLMVWCLLSLGLNSSLRFMSVRYLLITIPPLLLLGLRYLERGRWPGRELRICLVGSGVLSLLLSVADTRLAGVYRDFARRDLPRLMGGGGEGHLYFTGHWGLQFYLEEQGGQAVSSEGFPLPDGSWLVEPTWPWPQDLPAGTSPRTEVARLKWADALPVRTVDDDPPACFYANGVATGSRPTYLPWSLSTTPLEVIRVSRIGIQP